MLHFSNDELRALGVVRFGERVMIDRSVRILGGEFLTLGNDVRIDGFGVLSAGSAGFVIGDHVHIAAGCYLFGRSAHVLMEDFTGLSARVSLFTATDDYVEGYLTNPTVPLDLRKVREGSVILRKHTIVGCGSVILPNTELGFGASVGALSVVRKNVGECEIVFGNPAKRMHKRRDRSKLESLEQEMRKRESQSIPSI
jgi:acetyltransferase-like isoleucine patch superfamily enzyme